MAILFDRDRTVILKHVNNLYKDDELDVNSTCAKFAHVQIEGQREITRQINYYNLDVIIPVGYRVKSKNAIVFRKWANNVLTEYLLKGYVLNENRTLVTNQNYINLINRVDSIDSRLKMIENNELSYKKEKIIVNSEVFDAISYLENIVSKASNKILLVDPYVDSKALNILKNSNDKISLKIITSSKSKLSKVDINSFVKKYNKSVDISIDDSFHDRYLYIDNKIFHLGSSINYLGSKISQIDEVLDEDIKDYLRKRVSY